MSKEESISAILRILRLANPEQLDFIYHFVLHHVRCEHCLEG